MSKVVLLIKPFFFTFSLLSASLDLKVAILYPTNYCRIVGVNMFNLREAILFDRNNGKGVVPDQEGVKQVDVATKDKVRGTPNPGLGLKVETPHCILRYPSMGSKIRK